MSSGPATPATPVAGGIRLAVRLTPKASRNGIQGTVALADGGLALKVAVTTVPEAGKANAALVKLLAKALRVPKGAIEIVQGTTDRNKLLAISGAEVELMAAIRRLAGPKDSQAGGHSDGQPDEKLERTE